MGKVKLENHEVHFNTMRNSIKWENLFVAMGVVISSKTPPPPFRRVPATPHNPFSSKGSKG
eukprot:68239-Pelagomonas_calceolata.AAC.1